MDQNESSLHCFFLLKYEFQQNSKTMVPHLKYRQRNGTTTKGGSIIFPREGSAHVRCCENIV